MTGMISGPADQGTISLTFTMRRKMGILRRDVNRLHKAYNAL